MARPIRMGLGYFPLDTDFLDDRKMQRLSQKYGCHGVMTYVTILCEIYKTHGYYIPYSDDLCFDIGFTLHLDEELIRECIGFCTEIHLFDKDLLIAKQVLTSRGIQMRFREISKRSVFRIDPELEVSAGQTGVFAATTAVHATETPVIVTETPVSATRIPPNINGNENGKVINTKNKIQNEHQSSHDNGEATRRAELLQMAADATRHR